ncbi:DNA polymerase, partial [Rickettsiaceae bacterium]|nr:DNA polymerase [Rickettsiaceae bacterium]
MNKDEPLLIIDGYGFIFRAYHVQPPLTSPDGSPVGAIYGFTSMLLKLIKDFKPKHAVMVLDSAGKNFRHDLYDAYKANRPPAPDDLVAQLKMVGIAAKSLNFTCLSKQGFEADDIIATLAKRYSDSGKSAVVISADKDLMQLMDNHVKMYDPVKSKYITEEDVFNKFGVIPSKVRDVQALMGDKSDNIPGVAGVGPKTASQLINQFGDLEGLLSSIDQVKSPRQQELLKKHREDALISWKLVDLDRNVAIEQDADKFKWIVPKCEQISDFLNRNGFKSLNKRVENLFNIKVQEKQEDTDVSQKVKEVANNKIIEVQEVSQLGPLTKEIERLGIIAVNTRTTDVDGKIEFIICTDSNTYLIPFNKQSDSAKDLFSYNNADSHISFDTQLYDLFKDKSIKKISYDLKSLLKICDCDMQSFDDLQIMDYILSAGEKSKDIADIIGPYSGQIFDKDDVIKITQYFHECYKGLLQDLVLNKSLHLYEQIDLPLCYILHNMEQEGVKIDVNHLAKLSSDFSKKIEVLEKQIFSISGKEFNIGSPKQLGEILFDEMKLPFAKINAKSKSYSTNVDVLEKLRDDGHEIALLLLEYRHLTKLKSTYTEA